MLALALVAVASGGVLLATGPIVRSKVASAASHAHLVVGVGHVRPGFFSVTLRDVSVAPEGEPGMVATFPEIRVGLSASLAPRSIAIHRGEIAVEGTAEELSTRIARWKAKRAPAAPGKKKDDRELSIDGLSLHWTSADGTLDVAGASVAMGDESLELHAESVSLKRADAELVVRGAALELDAERRFHAARGDSVTVVVVQKPEVQESPAQSSSAIPAPPPLPVMAAAKKGKSKTPEPPVPAAEPFTPLLPFPDLGKVRAKLALVTTALAEKLPEGSEVRVPALAIEVRGPTPVTLGPGPFSFLRRKESLVVSFRSGADGASKSTPLSVELLSPVAEGEPTLVVDGGPLPLSLLGLREGALGFVEVSRATVQAKARIVLDSAGKSATFDGEAKLANASIEQPKLSRETLRGLTVGVSGRGLLTGELVRIDDGRLTLGTTHVGLHGTVEQDPTHLGANLSFDVPTVTCQDLASSVPQGLMPTVRQARFAGSFGARGRLAFDTKNLDALELEYTIDDRCRATEVPPVMSRERFATAFVHTITHPDGTLGEAKTGPGSGNWTELGGISPFMQVAVLTTEDGSFFRHHGFNHTAIRQSLVANVKARKFVRGASTITMQLAKNLFLVREKTLSRKLEEIVLADYLEQVFRKDDLIELYFNVVEFGPDVYGITQAASHYFGRTPLELDLSECLFLASILPSPVKSHRLAEHGELPEHWTRHLQSLMRIAEHGHRISPAELEEGLKEQVVFHKPGTPNPPPRTAQRSHGDLDTDAEGDWRRLD